MNDDARLERLFADGLADLAPTRAPDRLTADIRSATHQLRPRPRWLALIKEPSMRLSSSLAVGSPTARVAALVAATILLIATLAGAGLAGSRLLAADRTTVVDQAGGGDFGTIGDAVAAAQDGDTILVHPGTYIEAIFIDKDLTLTGDGPVGDIVITAPEGGPLTRIRLDQPGDDSYAVLLQDTNATLSDMTFRGRPSIVFASGGSPTLTGLVFEDTGFPYDGSTADAFGSSINVNRDSTAVIRGNTIVGGGPIGIFDRAEPLVEQNHLSGGPHIWGDPGDGAVIRGNTIEGTLVRAMGFFGSGSPLVEDNDLSDPGAVGIDIWDGSPTVRGNTIHGATDAGIWTEGDATSPLIEDNTIEDVAKGVQVMSGNPTLRGNAINGASLIAINVTGGSPELVDNAIRDSGNGIFWNAAEGLIDGNNVSSGRSGILLSSGAPRVVGNVISGLSGRGLDIQANAHPTLSGNRSCDNAENLLVANGSTPAIDDSNEICAAAPAG